MRARGSYALAVMFADFPEEIYVARKDSPMIIGVENGESYLASDVPAILKYTRNVYYIGNREIARLEKGKVTFFNIDREEISKELTEIKWDAEAAEKAGFEHFMMKEIHEQPRAAQDTLGSVISGDRIDLSSVGLSDEDIRSISEIYVVGCGSAYHAGVVMQYVTEELAGISVRVELASEFRYRNLLLPENALVVIISQSGRRRIASRLCEKRRRAGQGRWLSSTWSVLPSRGRRTTCSIRRRVRKSPWRRPRRIVRSSSRDTCWRRNLRGCAGASPPRNING